MHYSSIGDTPPLLLYNQESENAWATRWDIYLSSQNKNQGIHYFNLVNSVVIALFLTGMVALILLRALHKDISRYNRVEARVSGCGERGQFECQR